MGWNNSDLKATNPSPRYSQNAIARGRKSYLHFSLAVIAFGVLITTLAIIFCSKHDNGNPTVATKEAPKGKQIAVSPVKVPKVTPKEETAENSSAMPTAVGELKNGYRLLPSGRLHRVKGIVTNSTTKTSIVDRTFKHEADIQLGYLLLVQPGDSLLGDSEDYYEDFEKHLSEALEEEIVFEKDDTEFQRELKQGVIDMRKELKAWIAHGEDITKIMRESREQLRELGLYREELEAQVIEMMGESDKLNQKDYEDLVAAANQMLYDRGSKPLELPSSLKHMLRLIQLTDTNSEGE